MLATPTKKPRDLQRFESERNNPFATVVKSGKLSCVDTWPGCTLVDFVFKDSIDLDYACTAIKESGNAKLFFHAKSASEVEPRQCVSFYIVPCGDLMYTLCLNSHDGKHVCDAALNIYRDLSVMRSELNDAFEWASNGQYELVNAVDFNEFLLDFYG